MKIISKVLQAIRNLSKRVPWHQEESTIEDTTDSISDKIDRIIETLTEDNLKLKELIRLREEDSEKYPNIDFGVSVAKYLLLRGLRLHLKDHWRIKSWEHEICTFSKYCEDGRGGKGYFEIKILAEINRSWYSPPDPPLAHSVSAHLHIACATSEHFWVPNHSGSYVCIDGKECFEIQCDWGTGNIAIGEEGRGSHVPEWFKKDVVLTSPEALAQQA